MSKVAIIGDMHFGVKGGNQDFLDFQLWWLEECLKKLEKMGIDTIIQTGDMFDVRAHIKLNVLNVILRKFPDLLRNYGIREWITYAGNHDIFYRDSNEICSLDILNFLSEGCLEFTVWKDEVGIKETYNEKGDFLSRLAFVPWINKNNEVQLFNQLNNVKADYVFGHFEMVGMPMIPGVLCEHGVKPDYFKDYKKVISGHFHTISQHTNVTMVGTPYHLTWGDVQDGNNRGFWVLDTETDELTLHQNEDHMTLFSVIEYNFEDEHSEEFFEPYKGTICKVLVKDRPEDKHFKKFTKFLANAGFIDYKIIDTTTVQIEKVEISEETLSMDTLTALTAFIEGQADDFEKDKVKKLAKEVYMEVLSGG